MSETTKTNVWSKMKTNKWSVLFGVLAAIGVATTAYEVWPASAKPFGTPTAVSEEKAISDKGSNATTTVDFTVLSAKEFGDGPGSVQALLNDNADFRQSKMTIVIKKGCGVPTPPIGSKLQVTGVVTTYANKVTKKDDPEIVVTKADQIKLVN